MHLQFLFLFLFFCDFFSFFYFSVLLTSHCFPQGNVTAGYCRYRQAIPVGHGGRLDVNSNYGFRKSFLPQVFSCIVDIVKLFVLARD